MQILIRKRDGEITLFNKEKIINAINAAFIEVDGAPAPESMVSSIANNIYNFALENSITLEVENIQDMVEDALIQSERKDVAKAYIKYRERRTAARGNITDKTYQEFLSGKSDYWNNENSNKDSQVVTTQRDYIAGIASTDYARRFLLPSEICEAHDLGIIHQHDMDYMAQMALNNCCLINLEDMLQNGTVINGVRIDPQHRILTAATVATQIITAVASSQYGGTTITLTHLAPFVRMSYNENYEAGLQFFENDEEKAQVYADAITYQNIKDAVQTFNYQINSMSTTNGQ